MAIVAMPVLGFGFQICSHLFGWTEPPDFPLHFIVRTPKGDILAEKQATLAPGTGRDWPPLLMEFQPGEAGEYLLHLEVPTGVESVKVRVHELRKR